MLAFKYLLPLILISLTSYAQNPEKKWISIEPIKMDEKNHSDINKTKLQAGNKMIQNLTVIKNLLDHVNNDGHPAQAVKNWYSFEPSDND